MFGLGSDAYTIWSYREQIVTVGSAVTGTIGATVFAIAHRYPAGLVPLFALFTFAVLLALVGWGVRAKHYLASKRVTPELPTSQAPQPPDTETAEKREAAKKLLEDAFGQGQNLQKGMYWT
jgi:hypothetical protein